MLCDDLEGWDGGGWSQGVEIHVYIQLTHFVIPQELTQHCKAITLQLKNKGRNTHERKKQHQKNTSIDIDVAQW